MKRTTKKAVKFTVQYRMGGYWSNGYSYDTKEEAEKRAKASGYDYQIVKGTK